MIVYILETDGTRNDMRVVDLFTHLIPSMSFINSLITFLYFLIKYFLFLRILLIRGKSGDDTKLTRGFFVHNFQIRGYVVTTLYPGLLSINPVLSSHLSNSCNYSLIQGITPSLKQYFSPHNRVQKKGGWERWSETRIVEVA